MKSIVRLTQAVCAILFILALVGGIYFFAKWDQIGSDRELSHTARNISIALSIVGMVIAFLPLLGLIIKFGIKKFSAIPSEQNIILHSLRLLLQWERKSRLVVAWTAIVIITIHMILMVALINAVQDEALRLVSIHTNVHHGETVDLGRYSWEWQNICGFVGLGLVVLMNINGIAMLILRKRQIGLTKIKYIGQINLVFGISFFVLSIIHII